MQSHWHESRSAGRSCRTTTNCAALTPTERAIATAFQRLFEENLYWAVVHTRWAQPGRNPSDHTDRLYAADQFPFTYGVGTDPVSGKPISARLGRYGHFVQIGIADPYGAALYAWYKDGELKSEGNSITEGIGQGRVTANLDGTPIDITPGGAPKMVVFLAHWCPHCNREIPRLIEWQQSGAVPDGLKVVGVATAVADFRRKERLQQERQQLIQTASILTVRCWAPLSESGYNFSCCWLKMKGLLGPFWASKSCLVS